MNLNKRFAHFRNVPEAERQIVIHSIAISKLTLKEIFEGKVRVIADRHIFMRLTSAPNGDILYACSQRILNHRKTKLWKITKTELKDALEEEKARKVSSN